MAIPPSSWNALNHANTMNKVDRAGNAPNNAGNAGNAPRSRAHLLKAICCKRLEKQTRSK